MHTVPDTTESVGHFMSGLASCAQAVPVSRATAADVVIACIIGPHDASPPRRRRRRHGRLATVLAYRPCQARDAPAHMPSTAPAPVVIRASLSELEVIRFPTGENSRTPSSATAR